MSRALEGKPDVWPKQPDGIVGAQICAVTGLLPPNPDPNAGDKGCPTRFEYFIKGTVPNERENLNQNVIIDTTTNDLAAPGQTNNTAIQQHQVISDKISNYCLDCQHQQDKPVFVK